MRKAITFIGCASLLALVILAGACHKKRVAQLPPIEPAGPAPGPPPAPTCTRTAEPTSVEAGHAVVLSWTSQNATDFELQPGLGKQQAQGSTSVTPQESTTYTFVASGPGGRTGCTARVTIAAAAPPPPSAVREESVLDAFKSQVKDAYFDTDKANLRADAQQALAADAAFFKAHPDIKFTIEGHCDERGSEEYNLGLGDRRAAVAKNYVVALGISADRISTISYGKDRPVCKENDESCWWKNRRAHPAVKGEEGAPPGGL